MLAFGEEKELRIYWCEEIRTCYLEWRSLIVQ